MQVLAMKQAHRENQMSHYLVRIAAILFAIMMNSAIATSPSRPPYDHLVCSSQDLYCAFISSEAAKILEVIPGNNHAPVEYTIAGWYPQAYISDNGQKFVAIESIIIPGHLRDQPVFRLWVNGVLQKSVYSDEILAGRKPQTTSSGGYVWGEAIGFQGNDRFLLRQNDDSQFEIKF
jgi:hypothetical protein